MEDTTGKVKIIKKGLIYTVVAYQTRRKVGMASGRGMDHGTARWLRLLGKENSLWESVAHTVCDCTKAVKSHLASVR